MQSLSILSVNVIQMIEQTAAFLYMRKNEEGLANLDNTLQSLMQLIAEISNYNNENNIQILNENKINIVLSQAMNAIEKNDMILLADIFTFDLVDLLKEANNNLTNYTN